MHQWISVGKTFLIEMMVVMERLSQPLLQEAKRDLGPNMDTFFQMKLDDKS